jgi:hypothetical protein
MGVIFYLSAQPTLPEPPKTWLNTLFDPNYFLKKVAHFGVYGGLAFWWWRAMQNPQWVSGGRWTDRGTGVSPFWGLAVAFVASALYAASDEFHQSFVPGRSCRLLDVLFDATGAAIALGLIWRRKQNGPKPASR